MNFAEYKFVAWVGIPPSLHLDDVERALRAFFPELFLASSDQDEVDMWRFEQCGVVVELQRPAPENSRHDENAKINFVCMVAGSGQKPLDDASTVVAQLLTNETGVKCSPLENQ